MMVLIFYYKDAAAAKYLSRRIESIKTDGKQDLARVLDVSVWDGKFIRGDYIEVMPDVPNWQRKRIEKVYGPLSPVENPEKPLESPPVEEPVAAPKESKAVEQAEAANKEEVIKQQPVIAEPSAPNETFGRNRNRHHR